jgi:hypothetical protein
LGNRSWHFHTHTNIHRIAQQLFSRYYVCSELLLGTAAVLFDPISSNPDLHQAPRTNPIKGQGSPNFDPRFVLRGGGFASLPTVCPFLGPMLIETYQSNRSA